MATNFDFKFHSLLETWLENEFQKNFKLLNLLINDGGLSPATNADISSQSDSNIAKELFFFRRQDSSNDYSYCENQASKFDNVNVSSASEKQFPLDSTDTNSTNANYILLTNWLSTRQNPPPKANVISLTNTTVQSSSPLAKVYKKPRSNSIVQDLRRIYKFKTLKKFQTSLVDASELSPNTNHILSQQRCVEYLEQKLLNTSVENGNSHLKALTNDLICLVLTRPNDRIKRESLIYAYPHNNNGYTSEQFSNVNKLIKLAGMFVTLNEVMDIFASSPTEALQISDVVLLNQDNSDTPNVIAIDKSELSSSTTYTVGHIYENAIDSNTTDNHHVSTPILLLIALPKHKYPEVNVQAIAGLLQSSLHLQFGSITSAFIPYLQANCKNVFGFLDNFLSTFGTLLSSETSLPLLKLSNTFFIPLQELSTSSVRTTTLILQQLSIDEPTAINLCNYLNDFDSLDWLDESINFYKNGNDIERALSEHFARCLQIDSVPKATETSIASALFFENNHQFDLLELELSSFVVLGSCLIYRGMYVQSHLPPIYLHSIRDLLFARGLLTLTKYHRYDLVYFTRFYPIESGLCWSSNSITDQFLLVIGYGHLIQCSLVTVHRFDRSHSRPGQLVSTPTLNKLPSSFAFYVFLKESYRLLCLYLERFEFLKQLEDFFQVGKHISNKQLIPAVNQFTKVHRTSFMKKKMKKLKKILQTTRSNDSIPESANVSDRKETISSPEHTNSSCSDFDEMNSFSSGEVRLRKKPTEGNSSLCSFSTDSVGTSATFESMYFDQNSIYRFSHDYLPESLICFMNIESAQQFETFHGPILDEFNEVDGETPNRNILSLITLNLLRSMQEMRQTINRQIQFSLKRKRNSLQKMLLGKSDCDATKCAKSSPVKSGKIVEYFYDFNGQQVLVPIEGSYRFSFYLVACCAIATNEETGEQTIGDEFYACFKINSNANLERNNPVVNSRARSKSNRLSLPANFQLTSLADTLNETIIKSSKRSFEYEIDRLDFLLIDLEELIQVVRMGSWR